MASINKVLTIVKGSKPRSAWGTGVKKYAIELLEARKDWLGGTADLTTANFDKLLLNGASNWKDYSYGGLSLIYNEDIAKRLCTRTELAKNRNGELEPNARENWLDVQARALYQADGLIRAAIVSANTRTKKKTTVRRK